MALVYLARRVSDGLPVAVKILRNELAEDQVYVRHFWREGETLANLSHPNIVNIYGIGEQDDLFYMVMEYLPGQTLKQYIDQRGVLEVDEALDIAMQICNAMQHAHQNNVCLLYTSGKKMLPPPVKVAAQALDIPVLQ